MSWLKRNNIYVVGIVFATLSVLSFMLGYPTAHRGDFDIHVFLKDLYANISTELGSLAISVLLIGWLTQRNATMQERERLKLQLGSPDNGFAVEAARQLRARRWGFGKDLLLYEANLRGADLQGATLSFANLEKAKLDQANLRKTDLTRANLNASQLNGAKLSGASLEETRLQKASLMDAELKGSETKLSGAYLQGAHLHRAKLQGAQVQYADLRETQLHNANLQGTNLQGADLTGADLYNANLEGALIDGPQLFRVWRLAGATMPDGTRYDGLLALPGDLEWAREHGVDTNSAEAMREWYSEVGRGSVEISESLVTQRQQEYEQQQRELEATPSLTQQEIEQLKIRLQEILIELTRG